MDTEVERVDDLDLNVDLDIASTEAMSCGVSGDTSLTSVWKLPQLPLTEAFGPFDPNYPAFDQELMITGAGHVQLRYRLDPGWLYTPSNYAFRSNVGAKTDREMDFLEEFVRKCLVDREPRRILEIGGNDLTLARRLSKIADAYTVCDPVLVDQHGEVVEGIEIVGRPVEVAIDTGDFQPPDLVVSRHTIEHISDPRSMFQKLADASSPGCLFVVELPSLKHLAEALRFDAVFHQHYQYFDVESAKRLIWECGAEYVDHTYNLKSSNGGSLVFAFRSGHPAQSPPDVDASQKLAMLQRRIAIFTQQFALAGEVLDTLPGPVYGYGAGHMLATLGYHLNTDFARLSCILDDDPGKHGMTYRNIDVSVRETGRVPISPESSFLITSMENLRPIHRRIQDFGPRRILHPMIT